MSTDASTPPQIEETADLVQEGDWFRRSGKGFWHLQAHQEYGVVWSLCGVRMVLTQAEKLDRVDPAADQIPCANCQFKARQEVLKRGE